MNKVKMIAKVFLIVLLSLAFLIGVGLSILYFNVTAIRFEQSDGAYFGVNIPFFRNQFLAKGEAGYPISIFNWGYKEVEVYSAVNLPLQQWAWSISVLHEGEEIDIGYDVENDGKTIKVDFSGTAGDTPVEKEFVFDIQNASLDNLPRWINRVEEDDEFMDGERVIEKVRGF